MYNSSKTSTVLIENLPKKWKQTGAEKFAKSVSYIEKVVYGTKDDIEVFDFMLELAEKNKVAIEAKKEQIVKRLKALAS